MILVLGATGMFGGRIACGLLEAGRPVRGLVHHRDKGADLVTDTVRELTGREPITVEDRVQQHLDAFRAPVG
jgi:nucleoside-diphosphate-sugar epimerase